MSLCGGAYADGTSISSTEGYGFVIRPTEFLFSCTILAFLCSMAVGADEQKSKPSDNTYKTGQTTKFEVTYSCLGRGYVPYSYPAFNSCPCAHDYCFHPGQYYCGGKQYRKQRYRKWLRAHLGRGSMLDDTECECRFPTTGRPYYRVVARKKPEPAAKLELPPRLSERN